MSEHHYLSFELFSSLIPFFIVYLIVLIFRFIVRVTFFTVYLLVFVIPKHGTHVLRSHFCSLCNSCGNKVVVKVMMHSIDAHEYMTAHCLTYFTVYYPCFFYYSICLLFEKGYMTEYYD